MRLAVLVPTLALLLGGAALAREVVPAERRILPWNADMPGCGDLSVLESIQDRFADREAKYWNSNLRILAYERLRPIAWRPAGLDVIPRRFCTGTVLVSDGAVRRKRQINYVIREDLGSIGATWGVEWCVVGLDRHWANAPACRMDRP